MSKTYQDVRWSKSHKSTCNIMNDENVKSSTPSLHTILYPRTRIYLSSSPLQNFGYNNIRSKITPNFGFFEILPLDAGWLKIFLKIFKKYFLKLFCIFKKWYFRKYGGGDLENRFGIF